MLSNFLPNFIFGNSGYGLRVQPGMLYAVTVNWHPGGSVLLLKKLVTKWVNSNLQQLLGRHQMSASEKNNKIYPKNGRFWPKITV